MRASQPGQSFLLLLDVVDILNSQGIHYGVIGAVAASVHGVVRASLDADALLSLTMPSMLGLETDLKRKGFQTSLRKGASDDPISAVLTVTDSYDNHVDLLMGIRGFDPDAFTRTIDAPFGDETLHVIGLEDFIAMKVFAGGPQDLDDARRAIQVSKETLVPALLLKITSRYGKKYLKILKSLL